MTVFRYKRPFTFFPPDSSDPDLAASAHALPARPKCQWCRDNIMEGERVMHWSIYEGGDDLLFHADCVKRHARGLIKDIAECGR